MASSLYLAWLARFTQRRGRARRCQPSTPAERPWSVGALGMAVAGVPVGSWPERGRCWGGWRGPGQPLVPWGGLGKPVLVAGAWARGLRQGCVIYCTLLRAQPGDSRGCAGFRSCLPKAALSSLWLLHI